MIPGAPLERIAIQTDSPDRDAFLLCQAPQSEVRMDWLPTNDDSTARRGLCVGTHPAINQIIFLF